MHTWKSSMTSFVMTYEKAVFENPTTSGTFVESFCIFFDVGITYMMLQRASISKCTLTFATNKFYRVSLVLNFTCMYPENNEI